MTDTDRLEDRLRAALDDRAGEVTPSADAWQQNRRRLVAGRGDARRVRGRWALGAAAAAVAVTVGATALLGGGGGSSAGPAGGSGDPWASENLRGEPVVAETLTMGGARTEHELVLTDTTGDGPDLCDRYVSGGGSGGGCTTREKDADDPAVAIDWLSGTEGSGDIRGVLGAVDNRVSTVQIWMDNGDMVLATLHPTGWDDTRMFALTTQPPDAPTAQRLVAYGRDGNVLQAVELSSPFGTSWLTQRSACAGDRVAELVPDGDVLPNAYVALGTEDASISVRTEYDDIATACLEQLKPDALAGWYHGGLGLVAAVVAPEVVMVRLTVGETVVDEVKANSVSGSPWRVAVLRADNIDQLDRAELIALDAHSLELDRQPASQLGSASP